MTLLFDRKYKLTIGKPKTVTYTVSPQKPLDESFTQVGWQSGDDWRTTTAKDALLITDLQITASIKNTSNNSSASGGSTVIEVYNLSSSSRELIERTNNYIILEAGYAEDEELVMIFSGQVETCYTDRKGQDLITTLTCKEGYSPNNSVRFSKTFNKGLTYADILYSLAGAYADNGIPTGEIIDDWGEDANVNRTNILDPNNNKVIAARADPQDYVQLPVMLAKPANTKLINGYSAIGYLHQVLENVCKQIGYVSYITNGRLFIHPKGFTRTIEEFEFSEKQMKSIRRMESKTTGSSLGSGLDGIKITTFLDGRLDIDKRIKILDGVYAGSYKIITKSHNLDYQMGAWDTVISCKKSN